MSYLLKSRGKPGGEKKINQTPTPSNLKLGVFLSLPTLEAAGDNVLVLTESMQKCGHADRKAAAQVLRINLKQ